MRRPGTRTQLLAITLLPVLALFVTLTWFNYQSRQAEVGAELAERGQLLASALAANSEYSLMYGQFDELRLTVHGMMQTDGALHRVTVLDASRKTLFNLAARGDARPESRYYEAPVHKRLLYVNGGGKRNVGTMGYVQVRMSPTAMLRKAQKRFQLELAVALAGLLACAAVAWKMTSGFSDSLQASMRAVRAADAEKRRLLQRVTSAVEDERKAIALEIHDELNATLIAVRLEAQQVAALAAKVEPVETAETIRAKAQAITKLALGLYNSGRSLVRRLRPEVLDMLGLHGALEEMVRQYASSHAACRFTLDVEGDFAGLDSEVAISGYRIVQEALSNIVKHSRATTANVVLARRDGALDITVADNGTGFDPARTADGVGLAGMRERVQALGGQFSLDCASGTRIRITLPASSESLR